MQLPRSSTSHRPSIPRSARPLSGHIHAGRRLLCQLAVVCSVLAWVAAPLEAAAPGDPNRPQVGSNLGFLSNSAGEWPFVDVFKTASPWVVSTSGGWNDGIYHLDSDGWITELEDGEVATSFVFWDVANMMPHGPADSDQYTILYDGYGVLDYDGVVQVVSQSPGEDVVRIAHDSSVPFVITIVRTARSFDEDLDAELGITPADYIRNLRIIAPGGVCTGGTQDDPYYTCMSDSECQDVCTPFTTNYASQIFHPDFLNNLQPYDVLRFMDWMDTIGSDVTGYAGYPKESSAHWNRAPATVIAKLANRLDVDVWVNVPHLADQSFLDGFPVDLESELEPERKVYVEYSNEVWNAAFPAYQEVAAAWCDDHIDLRSGCADDADDQDPALCQGHGDTMTIPACDTARERATSTRSLASWDAFQVAFGNHPRGSAGDRIVRVLPSWIGQETLHENLLYWDDAYSQTDALATAAYFGWSLGSNTDAQDWDPSNSSHLTTAFGLLAVEVNETLADMNADRLFLANHPNPVYRDIPLVFYEGGQGIEAHGNNQGHTGANAFFDALNEHLDMGILYGTLLNSWQAQGGVLLNHYQNCHRWDHDGRYGALKHQRQNPATSPKYTALTQFIQSLP